MADITITASRVRPLRGAITRRFPAASTNVAVGKPVYVKSDGKIELADADAVGTAQARGVVASIGDRGDLTAVVNQSCDVVVYGPMDIGASGLTDGANLFVSTTAGAMDQTAPAASGDFPYMIGWAESDTIVFIQPQGIVPTVNP